MKTTLIVRGTHCPSCKALIEDVAAEIPGIASCSVEYTTGKTEIEHEAKVDWKRFKQEVEALGDYSVLLP